MKSQAERIKEIGIGKWLDEPMDLNAYYGEPMEEIGPILVWKFIGIAICITTCTVTFYLIAKLL